VRRLAVPMRTLGIATTYLAFCAAALYLGFSPQAETHRGPARTEQHRSACPETVQGALARWCVAGGELKAEPWDGSHPGGACLTTAPGPQVLGCAGAGAPRGRTGASAVAPATGRGGPALPASPRTATRSWWAGGFHAAPPRAVPGRTRGAPVPPFSWTQSPPWPWAPWGWTPR
jgi:hypothetical protein